MPVKTVILDRDGTLHNVLTGELQEGVADMLGRLLGLGLNLYVVSNETRDKRVEQHIGLPASQFLYRSACGQKGTKGYINKVLELSGSQQNEVVYLGDSEHDMREAAGRVVLFNAEWSNPGYRYGLAEESPAMFADDMEQYFTKEHPWYFKVDGQDALGRTVRYRALLDPATCTNEGITPLLKERREDFEAREADELLARHVITHLIASLYLEGIHLERAPNRQNGFMKPVWCIYPGRSGGVSPILRLFERFTARLLTMSYEEALLQRHQNAPSSHGQRMSGRAPQDISEQFKSVSVNPDRMSRVKGNVVLVVDDFSTGSNSMETSRNLLFACGAVQVIGITVGKYGRGYTACGPGNGFAFPSRGGPVNMANYAIVHENMQVVIDHEAIREY